MAYTYALLFVTELSQSALGPLLPTFKRELVLSDVETGAVLATTTAVTVLASVPIGRLADRFGAKRLVTGAAVLIAAGTLLIGLGGSFAMLLAGRALFGIAYAAAWTAGIALIAATTEGRRAAALGGTIAAGGAAHLLGPTLSGFLAEQGGVALPFSVIAGLAALVGALLLLNPAAPRGAIERRSLREAVRATRTAPELRTALVVIALVGLAGGLVPLLASLALADNGLSSGEIGLAFSAASAVGILVSVSAARLGLRAARVAVAGITALALGAAFLVPVASLATASLIVFLVLVSGTRNLLNTIVYPLGEAGARAASIGSGMAIGLLNVVWGATAAAAPLIGGAISQLAGFRPTFVLVAVAACSVGAYILGGLAVRVAPPNGH